MSKPFDNSVIFSRASDRASEPPLPVVTADLSGRIVVVVGWVIFLCFLSMLITLIAEQMLVSDSNVQSISQRWILAGLSWLVGVRKKGGMLWTVCHSAFPIVYDYYFFNLLLLKKFNKRPDTPTSNCVYSTWIVLIPSKNFQPNLLNKLVDLTFWLRMLRCYL
jgi:hypothetical protein